MPAARSNDQMKIVIIGNSVALRVRPPLEFPNNQNYTYFLHSKLKENVAIENHALGATTIINWVRAGDTLFHSFPDIVIVQIGVVDSTVREVPLWFYRLANRKIDNVLSRLLKSIYRGPISKARPILAKVRGKKSWISSKKFEKMYELLISSILKETNAQIITLPINLANERVEKELPGSLENHKKFNSIIQQVTKKHRQFFLNLSDLNSNDHYPDGVHFNRLGHKLVAKKLISLIDEIKNKR